MKIYIIVSVTVVKIEDYYRVAQTRVLKASVNEAQINKDFEESDYLDDYAPIPRCGECVENYISLIESDEDGNFDWYAK